MPDTQSTKPRRRYTDTDLDKLRAALKAGEEKHVPASKTYAMGDMLKALREEITDYRRRGYSIDQICQMITEGGFKQAHSTLRRYISELSPKRRKRAGKKKPKPNPRNPDSHSTPPTDPAPPGDSSDGNTGRTVRPDHEDL